MQLGLAIIARLAMAITVLGVSWAALGWAYGERAMTVVGGTLALVAGAVMIGIEHFGRP